MEQVKPTLEKMLDSGISEKELHAVGEMIDMAKDLIECDISLCRLVDMRSDVKSDRYSSDMGSMKIT